MKKVIDLPEHSLGDGAEDELETIAESIRAQLRTRLSDRSKISEACGFIGLSLIATTCIENLSRGAAPIQVFETHDADGLPVTNVVAIGTHAAEVSRSMNDLAKQVNVVAKG